MKKLICLLSLFASFSGFAQNLIQNAGFEQYTTCPDNFNTGTPDILSYCQGWYSVNETPDYYNTCSTHPAITPPNCYLGFQYPHSGNAFAGFVSYYIPNANYREIIGGNLLTTLVTGQKYFISFYVNLGGQNQATIGTNKIGVKFSTVQYFYSNPSLINNVAHFYTDSIITDTAKWTKISGSFIADSVYSYIIIGNFFNNSLTDTLNIASTNNVFAYYYIDDVCVTTDSLFNENWTGITEQTINKSENITIYPNPCTNELNVQYNNVPNEQTTISILDITGKTIMQTQTKESEFTFNTEKLAKGLFLVKVEIASTVALQKVTRE